MKSVGDMLLKVMETKWDLLWCFIMCYIGEKRTIDFKNHRSSHQRTDLLLVKKYMGVGLKSNKLQSNLHCNMERMLDLMRLNNPHKDKSPDSFKDFSVSVNVNRHSI